LPGNLLELQVGLLELERVQKGYAALKGCLHGSVTGYGE
jgi:hypothetical protein